MLQAIIGALCGVGLFFVLADVYRIPYLKSLALPIMKAISGGKPFKEAEGQDFNAECLARKPCRFPCKAHEAQRVQKSSA